MKRIFSGIQPTGDLHLGNYFGAIKNWVDQQSKFDCIYSIVDYHSMTMPYDPATLADNSWKMTFQILACGVKPENLYFQSMVPEHTELAWILSCVCSYGELTRMTQFKDKSDQTKEVSKDSLVSAGLLFYPVLQAADILLYRADYVPIGKDQEQHLELSRNIAERFNKNFGVEYFQHPAPLFTETPKILSLANPDKKMSKSLGDKHHVKLFGDEQTIIKQVKTAVTDSGETVAGVMSPGVKNLFELLKACNKIDAYKHNYEKWENGTLQYGALKVDVSEAIVELSAHFKNNLSKLYEQESAIKDQIYVSSQVIRKRAQETIDEVRQITGLPKLKR